MQVFYGIPFQSGDRILTGVHEYAANYIAFLQVWDNRPAHAIKSLLEAIAAPTLQESGSHASFASA